VLSFLKNFSVEHVESLFCGSEQIHYSTIQKELKNCCDKIDIIIAWETEHCDFLVCFVVRYFSQTEASFLGSIISTKTTAHYVD
jgi:hypothetical protein